MDHLKAIIIKFVMIAAVLLVVLTWVFDAVPFSDTLWISLVLTLVAYVLGDLMIFKKAGDVDDEGKRNAIATISDIVLAFVIIWLMGDAMAANSDIVTAAIISAVIIGAGEWFFHKYLERHVFHRGHHTTATTH